MKIGIYGGSFDPPHIGHVLMLHCLLLTQDLDKILILPTADHPIKGDLTPLGHRIQMCYDAFGAIGYSRVSIDPLENQLEKPNYTKKTLVALRERYPEQDLYYIIGSDLVEDIPDWEYSEGITDLATFMVVPRQGYPISSDAPNILGNYVEVDLGFPLPEISSTHIKKMVQRGVGVDGYIPRGVIQYLTKNGLYT